MKILSIASYFALLYFISGCNNLTPIKNKVSENDSLNFTHESKIENPNDTCQLIHHGNCRYTLCAPLFLVATPDSIELGERSSTRKLVKYTQLPMIVREVDGTVHEETNKSFEIYSNVIFKNEYGNVSFEEFIKKDIAYSMENGQLVSDKGRLITSDITNGHTYEFVVKKTQQYMAITYIDISKYIVMIVLSANNKTEFDNYYKTFEGIAKSFKYYGD